jgi:hypothetical protein
MKCYSVTLQRTEALASLALQRTEALASLALHSSEVYYFNVLKCHRDTARKTGKNNFALDFITSPW